MPQGSVLGLLLFGAAAAFATVGAKFLWFEKAPNPADRCTTTRIGLPIEGWDDFHPPPDCLTGGLIWYYTSGRVHGHFFLDPSHTRDFELCLTAGEANALYIWFDYRGKYWTPMSFPNYMIGTEFKERCKKSTNGTMDLFFESPWYKLHFVSHVTWEIKELPPGTDTAEEDVDTSDIPM